MNKGNNGTAQHPDQNKTGTAFSGMFHPFSDPDFRPEELQNLTESNAGEIFHQWMTALLLKKGFPCMY